MNNISVQGKPVLNTSFQTGWQASGVESIILGTMAEHL